MLRPRRHHVSGQMVAELDHFLRPPVLRHAQSVAVRTPQSSSSPPAQDLTRFVRNGAAYLVTTEPCVRQRGIDGPVATRVVPRTQHPHTGAPARLSVTGGPPGDGAAQAGSWRNWAHETQGERMAPTAARRVTTAAGAIEPEARAAPRNQHWKGVTISKSCRCWHILDGSNTAPSVHC